MRPAARTPQGRAGHCQEAWGQACNGRAVGQGLSAGGKGGGPELRFLEGMGIPGVPGVRTRSMTQGEHSGIQAAGGTRRGCQRDPVWGTHG